MIRRLILTMLIILIPALSAFPIEGMWIPLLLDSLNIKDMQERGLKLSAEDIYSINHASLKDAVVIFGGGCTGEIISPDGLLITNHHCGYSRIQSHSTLENNLLEKGFWASKREEELPNPGLTATFLVRIEDVTGRILRNVSESMDEAERNRIIAANAVPIVNEIVNGSNYQAEIKPFYFGSQYFLFVYEVFEDVRLVGTPPEAIGRFGGDTDNWIWPRHTGDFSLFRIYADKDNKSAVYSPDNIPYQPKKYLPVSIGGLNEGDFTMVIGYPGNTDEYLLSREVSMQVEQCLPAKIQMRNLKLSSMDSEMEQSAEKKLGYASRYVGISNSWKKWMGVIKGIQRSSAIDIKKALEKQFDNWSDNVAKEKPLYKGLMEKFDFYYDSYEPLYIAHDIGTELLSGIETFSLINRSLGLAMALPDSSRSYRKKVSLQLITSIRNFYRSSPVDTDREILPEYLRIYFENTSEDFHPDFYDQIHGRYKGDYRAFVDEIFSTSIFADTVRLYKVFIKTPDAMLEKMLNDPFHMLYHEFNRTLTEYVYLHFDSLAFEKDYLYRTYMQGLMEMDTARLYYPDANFTMRVTYGKIEGYQPADAVEYNYFTSTDGIFEKEDPDIQDYRVPQRLSDLRNSGDYGKYAVDSQVPVCFIASNHTSGGNSGSPVLNAEGHLIGINFDRNWEGTMSDYFYNPDICRNISLDMRYVLFIMDKYANASELINELTIIE